MVTIASLPGPVADPPGRALWRVLKRPAVIGIVVVVLFFAGLVGWSAVAPLASAAIAPGLVSPDGSRKTVQHLEGGIIREILVEEGDVVSAGDPLVLLEDTQASASYQLLHTQYLTLAATRARLVAEQSGADIVTFPDWLQEMADNTREADDPESAAGILAAQQHLFQTRRDARDGRKGILRQRIAQLDEEIEGLHQQIASQERQIELIEQEIVGVAQLVAQGLERQPRLLALQRAQADIEGERAANTAAIARAGQAIGEAELQIIGIDTLTLDEVANQLTEVQSDFASVSERLRAAEDVLRRTVITAPVAGTVVQLHYRTRGGVIGPGQPILDIVPLDDDLLIDVRVSPMDIDVVEVGLTAQVHLSAFRQRNLPRVTGIVRYVSADVLVDQNTGESYFRARVEVDRSSLEALDNSIELSPGMPAEVMIMTGEQTALEYILQPFLETIRRSFRES
ncbi:MAG: HlyD family type I secretion periplasmic adaptor subunit [Rhodospirillaceae bacterium]|nr:HlyD family type I secretion periplasmic adaptor subunit [Rhodospirillaceae bacterium]